PFANAYPQLAYFWWSGKDSNLRRQSRQIYSLIPLTAREPLRTKQLIMRAFSPPVNEPTEQKGLSKLRGSIQLVCKHLLFIRSFALSGEGICPSTGAERRAS